jgi:hypothetical protein
MAHVDPAHYEIEIMLVYPEGAKTVRVTSHARPWTEDGVLYYATCTKRIGHPMIHVRWFESALIYPET